MRFAHYTVTLNISGFIAVGFYRDAAKRRGGADHGWKTLARDRGSRPQRVPVDSCERLATADSDAARNLTVRRRHHRLKRRRSEATMPSRVAASVIPADTGDAAPRPQRARRVTYRTGEEHHRSRMTGHGGVSRGQTGICHVSGHHAEPWR